MLETAIQILLAGVLGTVLMSVTMGTIHAAGWANADMIRALGSLVTRRREGAFAAGLGIHLVAGALFAVPYTLILGALSGGGFLMTLGLGALLGLVHGIVMALVLLAVVSEKHPLEEFRETDFEVAVAHIVGHVAYGVGVGLVVAFLGKA